MSTSSPAVRQIGAVSRTPWTGDRIAAIAAGGALGAGARWAVIEASGGHRFPWPVLAVNVAGSLLLGLLLAGEPAHPRLRIALHDLGAIGFCGGLTTFSTFAVEVVDLVDRGDAGVAALYAVSSLVGAIVAVLVGAALGRRPLAIELPVEEEP
jgi:fluoride exporter